MDDTDGNGCGLGHLRSAVTPRSGHDLKAMFGEGTYEQGRENALGADALCLPSKQGLVVDSVSMERGRSRYSAARVMEVLMVMAPFERWHCKKVVERTRFSCVRSIAEKV